MLLQQCKASDSIVLDLPKFSYLTLNYCGSNEVMFRTPFRVVEIMCFWSFVKSQEMTTDSDS